MSSPLTHAERGLLGATKRWSNPANRRVVRLDELDPEARQIVLAFVEAARLRKASSREAVPDAA